VTRTGGYPGQRSRSEQDCRDRRWAALLQAADERVAAQIQTLRRGGDWQAHLALARRLHESSGVTRWLTVLLVAAQRPDATRVAGYEAWQALGRQVGRGEKGILIVADPTGPAPDPTGSTSAQWSPSAQPTYVWDQTQTYGVDQPLPAPPPDPAGLLAALTTTAASGGLIVTRAPLGPAASKTDPAGRTITVHTDLPAATAARALAHSLGHVLLHPDPRPPDCRGRVQLEAESVAYLLTGQLGPAVGDWTFPDVAEWATGADDLARVVAHTGQRVLLAAQALLADLDVRQAGREPDPAAEQALARRVTSAAARTQQVRAHITARAPASQVQIGEPSVDLHRLYAANTAAAAFYRHQLHSPAGASPCAYLLGRAGAVALATGGRWVVGCAPDTWTALCDHLRRLGFTDDELLAAGLAARTRGDRLIDVFRNRIVFAVHDVRGRIAGFIGRTSASDSSDAHRYLNTAGTALYRKGEVLFGLWEQLPQLAANPDQPLLLVEGAFDVLAVAAAAAAGPPGTQPVAVTPSGTALTRSQADTITWTGGPGRPIVVGFDADPAGQAAAARAWTVLGGDLPPGHLRPHRPLRWLDLPAGADPSAVIDQLGAVALHRLLADPASSRPLVDLVLDRRIAAWAGQLDWIEARVAAVRAIAPVIAAQPPDEITRLVIRTADRLDLHYSTVTGIVVAAFPAVIEAAARVTRAGRHRDRECDPDREPGAPGPELRQIAYPSALNLGLDHTLITRGRPVTAARASRADRLTRNP
jgi:DNA primase